MKWIERWRKTTQTLKLYVSYYDAYTQIIYRYFNCPEIKKKFDADTDDDSGSRIEKFQLKPPPKKKNTIEQTDEQTDDDNVDDDDNNFIPV